MAVTAVSTTKQTFQPQTTAASSGDSGFAQLLESRIAGLSGGGNQGASDPLLAALAQPVATQPRTTSTPSGTAQAQSATTTATPAKTTQTDSGSQTGQTQTAAQTRRDATAPHAGIGEDDKDAASRPDKADAANQTASESETTAQDDADTAPATGDGIAPAYVQAPMTPATPTPKTAQTTTTPSTAKTDTEASPEAAVQVAASQAAVEAPETAESAPSAPAGSAQTTQAAAAQSAELAKTAKDTKVSVKVDPAKPEQDPAAATTTDLAPGAAIAAQSEAQARGEGENAEPEAQQPAPLDTGADAGADTAALRPEMAALQALAGQTQAQAGQGGATASGGNAVSGVQSVAAATATGLGETRAAREGAATGQTAATRQTSLPNALDQIKVQVGKGLAEGKDTISVRLNPDNMGRVDIKLELQEGRVRAVVTADRPETLQLLKTDSTNLVQALQDAGLETDSSQLSFQLRGEGQDARQFAGQREQGGTSGGQESTPETIAEPVSVATSSSDGLDISV